MIARVTLLVFLVASGLFVLGLVAWLLVMMANRNPRSVRRFTLSCFLVATAALLINAFS